MRERHNGSLQSTNVPTSQNIVKNNDNNIYRCMIIKVLFSDDKDNITSGATIPEVLYDVIILGGFKSGQRISNCRLASILGGNNNYYERILKATSKVKKIDKIRLNSHDGDVVYVQFVQGHSAYPVIIGLDKGIQTNYKAATKEDGERLQWQFNGIFQEINKLGEYCFVRYGGSTVDGVFTPNTEAEYSKKILENEIVTETFKSGLTNNWNGKDDVHTRTYAGGLSITEDGKNDAITLSTNAGAVINVDGKSGKITISKGSTIIELDSNSDKISLKGGFVDLGSSVSDFAVLFTELLTTFNMHTHPFVDITPGGPVPSVTMPPLAPMLASVGSTTVKVQS